MPMQVKARVQTRTHSLNRRLKEGLRKINGVQLYTPMSEDLSSGLCGLRIDLQHRWHLGKSRPVERRGRDDKCATDSRHGLASWDLFGSRRGLASRGFWRGRS